MDLLQFVGSIGGISGVLAVIIFLMYRHLVSQMRVDRKYMEDRLTTIIADYNSSHKDQQSIQVKHTQVLTELLVFLKAKNGGK